MKIRPIGVLAGVLLLAARPQTERGLEIHWIDVEGGAATLVVTPEGEALLMDCGWPGPRDAARIAKAASGAGVKKIDHYLTSHWHTDHVGGVPDLVQAIPVGRFYDHGFPDGNPGDVDPRQKEAYLAASAGRRVTVKPGDTVELKGARVLVLASHGVVLGEEPGAPQTRACSANPPHPPLKEDTSDNARSIGFLLEWKGFKFLDMGDLTWNVEHKLVCPKNLIGSIDVYQVTHHGLDISNHPALLEAVRPTVAVMNNGARKGGVAKTYHRLRETPGLKDIFQLHRNVATGPEDNAPPEFVANDLAECQGEEVRLTVLSSGKGYSVEVPSKGTRRSYSVK
jgi:beta-lactamase superfamily II metal-dependent hydrolase